jgi:peptidoglycan/LPS O-acetylase OafA/YrhL
MKSLDLIRAVSGIIVFMSHIVQIFVLPFAGRTVLVDLAVSSATYAVVSFFVLSGYLIAKSIGQNISNLEKADFDVSKYALKRFLRIYPPLVFSILLVFAIWAAIKGFDLHGATSYVLPEDRFELPRERFEFSPNAAFATLAQLYAFGPGGYLEANGPLWSLSYEVGFYLFAGLFVKLYFTLKRHEVGSTVLLGVLIMLFGSMIFFYKKGLFLYYYSIWAFGLLCFFRFDSLLFWLIAGLNGAIFWVRGISQGQLKEISFAIGMLLLIKNRSHLDKRLPGWLQFLSARMAQSTYSLYILHFPLLLFLFSFVHKSYYSNGTLFLITTILGLALVFGMITKLARYLENHVMFEQWFKGIWVRLFAPGN